MRRFLFCALVVGVVAQGLPGVPGAIRAEQASPCDFSGIERVVAVGDVHGAYDRFVEILRATGLLDAQLHWSGGKTHLVQLGDVVDRGPDSRKAIDLLRHLADEAAAAGGQVHQLLGNHEVGRMLGDMRYTTPGEYQAFVTADSERLRQRFVETAKPEARDDLLKRTPLGYVEMRLAFQPDGEYAQWLHTLNTAVKIDGVVFLHGGISPAVADMSCDAINEKVRRDLTTDFDKTIKDPLDSLAAKEDGPLWYRGLVLEPDTFESKIDDILARQHATTIVVAHTVTPTGRIVSRFGGKVVEIDTGMQPAYVPMGRASALEIHGGVFTAIYLDRQDTLFDQSARR
jgi:Calcineurin-like phosphoesterase